MCLNFGTPKMINFLFGTNRKSIILGVPILKHITVIYVSAIPRKNTLLQAYISKTQLILGVCAEKSGFASTTAWMPGSVGVLAIWTPTRDR